MCNSLKHCCFFILSFVDFNSLLFAMPGLWVLFSKKQLSDLLILSIFGVVFLQVLISLNFLGFIFIISDFLK